MHELQVATKVATSDKMPEPAVLKQTIEALMNGHSSIKLESDQSKSRRVIPKGLRRLSSDNLTERVQNDLEQIAALARPQETKSSGHALSNEQRNQLFKLETLYGKGRPSKIISSKSGYLRHVCWMSMARDDIGCI